MICMLLSDWVILVHSSNKDENSLETTATYTTEAGRHGVFLWFYTEFAGLNPRTESRSEVILSSSHLRWRLFFCFSLLFLFFFLPSPSPRPPILMVWPNFFSSLTLLLALLLLFILFFFIVFDLNLMYDWRSLCCSWLWVREAVHSTRFRQHVLRSVTLKEKHDTTLNHKTNKNPANLPVRTLWTFILKCPLPSKIKMKNWLVLFSCYSTD